MQSAETLQRKIKTLRERLSRLSEASLRINESLDVETVLQEVLESARALAESRYGVITLLDERGSPQDFLASGMAPEEARRLWELPQGMRVFEALSRTREPLRVEDFHDHVRTLGLPEVPLPLPEGCGRSFLAAPVRHRDEPLGYIFLSDKKGGGGFTREDEETLVMFASQAALVIAHSRRYRDEQRARADLETLIDTSPVGVVVFAGKAAVPSFNREAVRILEGLRTPDQPPEQLLEIMTVHRADGRAISLKTDSLAQALGGGETLRAEEVVIEVPDGRRVTVLINATPIHSEEGGVESFVVTLQDMTALMELEQLRAQFLAMVSHELRTPLAAIKGAAVTVLAEPSDHSAAEMAPYFRIINHQADQMTGLIHDLLDVARLETGTLQIHPEPTGLAELVDEARAAFTSSGRRHPLRIELEPGLPLVTVDRRRIGQVFGNLLDNAARLSPESSTILVTGAREGVHIAVSVVDQGRGVTAERLPNLFRKFPRSEDREAGGAEGSGLGLPICKGIVEAHGGRIWAESAGIDQGTRFTFTLPMAEVSGEPAPGGPERTGGRGSTARNRGPILVVDDDPHTLRMVRGALRKAGYAPVATGNPQEVPGLMERHEPRLLLLDLVMPGVDGVELMKSLSKNEKIANVPVIFISAYGQDEVIARALDAGAADYMVKPFSPTELAARIRAALRRKAAAEPEAPAEPYVEGELTVDYAARTVTVAGRHVHLTDIEFRLLAELSIHAGRVVTYDHLLNRVWKKGKSTDLRSVRAAVKNLRQKLGDSSKNPTWVFNVSRVGYRMPGEIPP